MFFVDLWERGKLGRRRENWDTMSGEMGHHGKRLNNLITYYILILNQDRITENL